MWPVFTRVEECFAYYKAWTLQTLKQRPGLGRHGTTEFPHELGKSRLGERKALSMHFESIAIFCIADYTAVKSRQKWLCGFLPASLNHEMGKINCLEMLCGDVRLYFTVAYFLSIDIFNETMFDCKPSPTCSNCFRCILCAYWISTEQFVMNILSIAL